MYTGYHNVIKLITMIQLQLKIIIMSKLIVYIHIQLLKENELSRAHTLHARSLHLVSASISSTAVQIMLTISTRLVVRMGVATMGRRFSDPRELCRMNQSTLKPVFFADFDIVIIQIAH